MTTFIGEGPDNAFLDDILLKEGSLGKWEERINGESPTNWFDDWDPASPVETFTADSGDWRVHYKTGYPLTIYHKRKFIFGIAKNPSLVHIDQNTENVVWAKIDGDVIVEREDFIRFATRDRVRFSHTPKATEKENVFRLGNGYSLACSRRVDPLEFGAETRGSAWWMIGPTDQEEELSHRVLMVKLYDGPHKYQSRGTDIILSDPAPLNTESEYVIYSYDEEGIKGLYREVYKGVKPQKHAMTIRGDELLDQMISFDGEPGFRDGQLTGPGIFRYSFPLEATKLLKVEWRGSEVEMRMRPDSTDWQDFDNYDGKAVTNLELEFDVFTSLSSIRIEWESLKHWVPVGRPKIDILPAGWGGNLIRMEVEEGEGLLQSNSLYSGAYTVSANVKCKEGKAVIAVGGVEMVSWNPLDKSIRGAGDFVANNDIYDFVLTGRNRSVFEIDRFRIAEVGQRDWVPDDMNWYIETESGKYPASDSINNPEVPVGLGEAKNFRIGVDVPEYTGGLDEIAVSGIYNKTFRTGSDQILREIRWNGDGKSRVYYPQNVTHLPVIGEFIEIEGRGAIAWEQQTSEDEGDVEILLDGARVAYKEEYTYRPVTLKNRRWRVDVGETRATIYLDDEVVGYMLGIGLPFRITQNNSEDVQLDCSVGFIQLRRELGPRFEGWDIGESFVATVKEGPRVSWGRDQEEAIVNMPFYTVKISV